MNIQTNSLTPPYVLNQLSLHHSTWRREKSFLVPFPRFTHGLAHITCMNSNYRLSPRLNFMCIKWFSVYLW
jgi:hypothetical protein